MAADDVFLGAQSTSCAPATRQPAPLHCGREQQLRACPRKHTSAACHLLPAACPPRGGPGRGHTPRAPRKPGPILKSSKQQQENPLRCVSFYCRSKGGFGERAPEHPKA